MSTPREYLVFLRGPAPLMTYGFMTDGGTEGGYRAGVQHLPLIVDFPEPADNQSDDFGLQGGGGFTVVLADEPDDRDWFLQLEDFSFWLLEDNTGRITVEY